MIGNTVCLVKTSYTLLISFRDQSFIVSPYLLNEVERDLKWTSKSFSEKVRGDWHMSYIAEFVNLFLLL